MAQLLCVLVIALPLALAIGAVFLQVSCFFAGAPVPSFSEAMVVSLVNNLACGVVGFVTSFLFVAAMRNDPRTAQIVAGAINILTGMVISAFLYSVLLQSVTFGKGILIWFMQLVIVIGLLIVVGLISLGLSQKGKHRSSAVPTSVARFEFFDRCAGSWWANNPRSSAYAPNPSVLF